MIDNPKAKSQKPKVWKGSVFFILLTLVIPFYPGQAKAVDPGTVIVKLNNSHAYELLVPYAAGPIDQLFDQVYRLKTNDIQTTLAALRGSRSVVFAEADQQVKVAASAVDPLFSQNPSDLSKQWYLPKMKVPEAWDKTKGSGLTVAVIDTGIDGKHEDLSDGRVTKGYVSYCQALNPAMENDCLVRVSGEIAAGANSDDNGHGTIVAGIIGGIPNNNKGVTGIVWNVLLMPIKVLDSEGSGLASDVAVGMKWAVDNGARVLNLSLGGPGLSGEQVIAEAVSYAFERGAVIVAAAGNDSAAIGGNLNEKPTLPVCADGGKNMIIGVAGVDIDDRKLAFSNYGGSCIDIAAPGAGNYIDKTNRRGVVSTYYDPTQPGEQDLYVYALGTSVAAPMVSGVAALMMSSFPDLDAKAIRDRLLLAVDSIDDLNLTECGGGSCMNQIGKGRLNALKAVTSTSSFFAGTIVRSPEGALYLIERGLKRPISEFVFNQRFAGTVPTQAAAGQLETYPVGTAVSPTDGVLLKDSSSPTVYIVEDGQLRALSYLAFSSRRLQFNQVLNLPASEVASYERGADATVVNGALLKTVDYPAVYILRNGLRQLVSYFVFQLRGLGAESIATVSSSELSSYPQAEEGYLYSPPDGTLFRGGEAATVYVILEGKRHGLTLSAFQNRGYSFGSVKVISQGEVGQYELGADILQ